MEHAKPGLRMIAPVVAALWIPLAAVAQEAARLTKSYLVVTDRSANGVFRFETDGAVKDTFVATPLPEAVAFGPDQNVYATSFRKGSVERFNGATGNHIAQFASGRLEDAEGLAFGPDGDLYVVDRSRSAVLRFDGATGAYIDDFVKPGRGGYNNASGITFGPDRNLYLTSGSPSQSNPGAPVSPQILRFDGRTGDFIDVFVTTSDGGLKAPFTLIFGPDRNLYVSSVLTDSILRYNGTTGEFIDAFVPAKRGGLSRPTGLTFGPDGNLYVASSTEPTVAILRYDGTTGAFIDTFITAEAGGLKGPTGVLFYSFEAIIAQSGRDTTVAADSLDNRIVGWIEDSVVKGQAFDSDGKSVGPPQTLSTITDAASHPRVIATSTGSSLAVWVATAASDGGTRVYARPVSRDGVPAGPPREISLPPPGFRDESPAVALAGAKAVVCWSRKDASGRGAVMARLIDAQTSSPVAAEVTVSAITGSSNEAPVIASDSNNLVAIAWRRRNDSANSILLSITSGSLGLFSSRVVDDGSEGAVGDPSISANPTGLIMVAWSSTTLEPDVTTQARPRVKIKVLPVGAGAGAGAPAIAAASVPFVVNADEFRQASSPQITVGRNGVAGVVWQYEGLDGGTGIYGRAIDAAGVIDKSDFVVFDAADDTETFSAPAVAADAAGTLTISSHKTVSGVSSVFTRIRAHVPTGPSRRRSVRH